MQILGCYLGGQINVKALRGRVVTTLSLSTNLHQFFILHTTVTTGWLAGCVAQW